MIRRLARPMLASVFIIDGIETLRNPQPHVQQASPLVDQATPVVEKGEQVINDNVSASVPPVPKDTETIVKVLAGAKIGAGSLFAFGKLPRTSALVLTGAHVPSTLSRHSFWLENDPAERSRKTKGLATDVALLGALILATADTAGHPGLAYRAGKARKKISSKLPGKSETEQYREQASKALHEATDQAKDYAQTAREKAPEIADTVKKKAPVYAAGVVSAASDFGDRVKEQAEQARAKAAPYVDEAREKAAPYVDEAREKASAVASQAADQAAPYVEDAQARLHSLEKDAQKKAKKGKKAANRTDLTSAFDTVRGTTKSAAQTARAQAEDAADDVRARAVAARDEKSPELRRRFNRFRKDLAVSVYPS